MNISWLSLAQSKLEADRKYAFEMALAQPKNFQEELLFWFHQFEMGFWLRMRIYEALEEKTRKIIEHNPYNHTDKFGIEGMPGIFVPDKSSYSKEKEAWVALASSNDENYREWALETLKGNAEDFQDEIRCWLKGKLTFVLRYRLFYTLTEENQALYCSEHNELLIPGPIWDDGSFEIYMESEDKKLKDAILLSIFYAKKPMFDYKLNIVKQYRMVTSASLKEAKEVVYTLFEGKNH